MIQTYYGNGKGKTTAAIGAAIRFLGCGKKVLFVEFLKSNESSEFKVLRDINGIDVLFSDERYNLYDNLNKDCTPKLSKAYNKLLFEDTRSKTSSCQMVILDEILDAIEMGYINEDEFIDFLEEVKESEIILTGHKFPEKIAKISDYISEIKEIKHPYEKGVSPREGIEF